MNKFGLVGEPTTRAGELEGPQEVVRLLEVGSDSANLVDEISTALDTNRSKALLDDRVVGQGDTLLVELCESTLEDKLLNSRARGVTVGYVRLDETEHTDGRLVELDEGSIVELTETEELHNLLGLGRDSDGTSDTDNKSNLGPSWDVESTLGLGLTAVGNSSIVGSLVLSSVLLGGSDGILLVLALLLPGIVGSLLGLHGDLGLSGLLLEDGFGD